MIRFVCVSLLHFQFSNEFELFRQCMKYLAMNQNLFKYPNRAFLCCLIGIVAVLLTEALSVYYVLVFDNVLDLINQFIKLKILSMFDDFFAEPFKQSSMKGFMGIRINVKKYRKCKIIISKEEIEEIIAVKKPREKTKAALISGKMGEGIKNLALKVEDLENQLVSQTKLNEDYNEKIKKLETMIFRVSKGEGVADPNEILENELEPNAPIPFMPESTPVPVIMVQNLEGPMSSIDLPQMFTKRAT